ncbi:uncharacterized protein LOC102230063 isoform X2 [Xiphophorus maculatus]|uniref:uncharacterized protein LOC102230063 isoform X2 n=1 Tax=Xiphophorus maculatus TaxID=8083 RepID=UPI000C6E4DCD|nr:uncharacterized protein LOC102230063 isoform X2 [Xiphophorus maculatus]XP_032439461.1 uncharacterized protein LOC116732953 isoform X2 [Xiphophorus hellerii]
MLRRESDTHSLFTSGETSDNDCEMGASCEEVDIVCLCEAGPRTLYSEAHAPTLEECALSDPQGESDADADIEDTDCRIQEHSSLQRISSRRRKRPRVARQDTTESEDDGGRSHKSHRWNLRLSPDRAHSRTILEESVSQVRPLIITGPNVEKQKSPSDGSRGSKLTSLWPSSLPLPVKLLLLLPVSLSLVIVIISFLLPWTAT